MFSLTCIYIHSRRSTGAFGKGKSKNDELNCGYKLRETDNRLNRTKHRQPSSLKSDYKSLSENNPSSRSSSAGSDIKSIMAPLSMKELRQKGLTKYDAELLIAQGCKFSDIDDDHGTRKATAEKIFSGQDNMCVQNGERPGRERLCRGVRSEMSRNNCTDNKPRRTGVSTKSGRLPRRLPGKREKPVQLNEEEDDDDISLSSLMNRGSTVLLDDTRSNSSSVGSEQKEDLCSESDHSSASSVLTEGIMLRNHKRLNEPLIESLAMMKEKVNNLNTNRNNCSGQLLELKDDEISRRSQEKIDQVEQMSVKESGKTAVVFEILDDQCKDRCKNLNSKLELLAAKQDKQLPERNSNGQFVRKIVNGKLEKCWDHHLRRVTTSRRTSSTVSGFLKHSRGVGSRNVNGMMSRLDDGKVGDTAPTVIGERTKDVYEFDDKDDCDMEEPRLLRRSRIGFPSSTKTSLNGSWNAAENIPKNDSIESTDSFGERDRSIFYASQTTTPSKGNESGGRLKLTLRMKRSPVLDEVIESGNSFSEDSYEPEYEVLRVEGVGNENHLQNKHRKKRHKSKDREKRHRRETLQEEPGGFYSSMVHPPMKRLRLIFGNETHTIDIPSTATSKTLVKSA